MPDIYQLNGAGSVLTPSGTLNYSTSVDKGYLDNTRILVNIMTLLRQTIMQLQSVASSQADLLNFYSSWQRMQTQVTNQIPTITVSPTYGIAGTADNPNATNPIYANARASLNTLNAQLAQTQSGYRDQISSKSKSYQSNLNQTTDQINQNSNSLTSFLQELTTILSSIFR